METEFEQKGTNGVPFNLITKNEISKLINEFPRNKNGEINGGCPEFRQLHQRINNSDYPINNDGTPDMRCTKNPLILKMKLERIISQGQQQKLGINFPSYKG
jgi:hypothetical protein